MQRNTIWPTICGILLLVAACASRPSPTPVLSPTAPTVAPPGDTALSPTKTICPPTATPSATEAAKAAEIDAWLRGLVKEQGFSGSVLVARQGRVVLCQGYGLADRQKQVPNTAQTRFRLGSITKQFTAMAILVLQAQGKLHVQDLLCDYITDCPPAWEGITLEHLLTHTSGIPDFTSFSDYRSTQATPSPPLETIARFRDRPLNFQPGEGWSYSNSGYIVLGYVIEQASGQSYEGFLQHAIFTPLDLRNTGYDHNLNDLAIGYRNGYSTLPAEFVHMSIPYAAGALYSNVQDLYRWDQMLYTEQLLPRAQIADMFAPHAAIPGSGGGAYGYGWFVGVERGRQLVFHPGVIDGFASLIVRYPEDQATFIMLSNQEDTDLELMQETLSGMVFGAK